MGKYRNVPGTEISSDTNKADCQIIYKGFSYNYWTIEDYLWDTFKNETNVADWTDNDFNDWIFHNLKRVYNVFENYHINTLGEFVLI